MTVKKNKPKIKKVSKPYLKGDMYDRTTLPGAFKFFLGMVGMAVAFLIFCVMLNIDNFWLRVAVNLAIVMGFYLFFAQFGMNAGADAVNQGEIMYARQEKGLYPEIWPANAFIGNYLRLDILLRLGYRDTVRENIEGYFLYMAEKTGTLWENIGDTASCNHGFASYVLYWLNQLSL